MKSKYLILFIILSVSYLFSQTIELSGKQITFGMSEKELQGSFWQEDGQIESSYPYINVYEGNSAGCFVNGSFYNGKLVSVSIGGEDILPVSEIENLIAGITPYKEETEEVNNMSKAYYEYYKTEQFYICKFSFRLIPDYTVIPVTMFEDIQKAHPDYLNQFNK